MVTGQGELACELPEGVRLLNRHYSQTPVLDKKGRRLLAGQVLGCFLNRGTGIRLFPYLIRNFYRMMKRGCFQADKLFWRVLSEGGQRLEEEYDLAVAFLEGGSAYYVADHVKADKKAAFIHVDYGRAGYTRELDRECYLSFDRIFAVSEEVRSSFLEAYPECAEKTEIFHNLLNEEAIREKAGLSGGFTDDFDGFRILTVGRLVAQKAYEVSIEAMRLLKDRGERVRWYVLGEGDERAFLEEKIKKLGLTEDFLLLGAVENPYPYMAQADLYVHATRFEGKSIAVQEAQLLGKPVLLSDCSGNREQVSQGIDGELCSLRAEDICSRAAELLHDEQARIRLGRAASEKKLTDKTEIDRLLCLLDT